MATQLKQTDFTPQAAPRANIRVVFSAGPATLAIRDALADLPAAVREASLDELAIAAETRAVIEEAAKVLSPQMFTAFLRWGEAASHFSSECLTDEEGIRRMDATTEALEQVAAVPVMNVHDHAFKAHLLALEVGDCSCFGPTSTTNLDDGLSIVALANGVAADRAWLSHLPGMLDDLSRSAWDLSSGKASFTLGIGAAITSSFTAAIARDAGQVQAAVSMTIPGVPAGYDPFMRGSLIQWQRQYARYEEARDALRAYDRNVHTPTFANKGVADDIADAVQERFDELVYAEHDAVERLYRVPAPSAVELAIKLKIFDQQNGWELTYAAEAIRLITIDARRHGRLGAHLEADAALLEAFATRRRDFVGSEGVDLSGPAEDAYFVRLDDSETVLLTNRATTVEGVLAKLRVGFANIDPDAWSDQAMSDPVCAKFRDGLKTSGRYEQLLWSAIEDLARIGGVSLSEQGR